MKLETLAMILTAAWLSTAPAGPRQPVGDILNPSAEMVDAQGRPAGWTLEPAPLAGSAPGGQLDVQVAHAGKNSLRLSTSGTEWTSKVLVKPYATYRLTAWIRTQDVPAASERGATLQARGVSTRVAAPRLSGSQDWTRVELTVDTEGQDSFILAATMGGPRRGRSSPPPAASGTAWFDDLHLHLLTARELQPSVTIDGQQTRPAMSDMVYGQFIEHLGRSIYGGIWAEMLADRKFYSAVGETRRDRQFVPSPWKAIGPADAVSMNREHPYVGEHTPQVDLKDGLARNGIVQSGLGVVGGKRYTGYVILAGEATAGPIEISLAWGDGATGRQTVSIPRLTAEFRKYPIRFRAGATSDDARLEVAAGGQGVFRIGPPSLMPEDHLGGLRRDTLELLRQLDAPIYRWPGGNFVSGYNWKDGIGDRDRRPPRKNPAWSGIEHNDFGMHEFFALMRELKAQPFIALNAGLGSVESAVQEVEYVNGAAETPMGRLRAANGHPAPFGCTYWAVGNEMSGDWQLGNVPISEFVQRHNSFSQALLRADPNLKLVASGEAVRPSSDWDRQLLSHSAAYVHLNSKHFYRQDWHGGGLLTHVRQIGDAIRAIADAHREYQKSIPQMRGRDIKVSLDEWNYWYGPHVFGELGTRYYLRDALGIAAGINEYSRQSDVITLACYAQTVNVIGAIKTNKTAAILDSTGQALVMYRRHFGSLPVAVTGAPEPLDVAAAWTRDKKVLTISVVNPTFQKQRLQLQYSGLRPDSRAQAWVLSGTDDMAFNEPGQPPLVSYRQISLTGVEQAIEVDPVTATIIHVRAAAVR